MDVRTHCEEDEGALDGDTFGNVAADNEVGIGVVGGCLDDAECALDAGEDDWVNLLGAVVRVDDEDIRVLGRCCKDQAILTNSKIAQGR